MGTFALAAFSSVLWGTADFLGGSTARRLSAIAVAFCAQAAGLAGAAAVVAITGSDMSGGTWAWGLAAGAVGAAALAIFYRALAAGVMSLVAPVSAAGAIIPVAVAFAGGDEATALAVAGMALAVLGAVGCGLVPGQVVLTREALVLAVLAAVGIGALVALLQQSAQADGSSGLGAVLAARVAGFSATALALGALAGRPLRGAPLAAVTLAGFVGLLDTAANAVFALASEDGTDTAIVAVLGSLYPVVTVALAAVLLRERLTALQSAAALAAIGGAALASAG